MLSSAEGKATETSSNTQTHQTKKHIKNTSKNTHISKNKQLESLRTSFFTATVAGVPVVLVRPAEGTGSNLFRGGRIYGGGYNETEAYLYFCR